MTSRWFTGNDENAARVTMWPWNTLEEDPTLPQAVRPDPTLQRWREQWGVEEHHLIPAPESNRPTHHLYPVWESSLLKPICSQVPMASSKTLMRQEQATRRARKPVAALHDQTFNICNETSQGEQSLAMDEKLRFYINICAMNKVNKRREILSGHRADVHPLGCPLVVYWALSFRELTGQTPDDAWR